MYYLDGFESTLKTVIGLVKSQDCVLYDLKDLKRGYMNFMRSLQPSVRYEFSDALNDFQKSRLHTVLDTSSTNTLSNHFLKDSILNDKVVQISSIRAKSPHIVKERIEDADKLIQDIDVNLSYLFRLVTNVVFYSGADKQAGGSSSSAVGVLWCSFKKNWTTYEIAEFFVHELTHTCMFLDELSHGHYHSFEAIADDKNFALSTILNCKRPMDKVLHSLIVAWELIQFREKLGSHECNNLHPSTDELIKSCKETIYSIEQVLVRNNILQERALELLKNVKQGIRRFENEKSICS